MCMAIDRYNELREMYLRKAKLNNLTEATQENYATVTRIFGDFLRGAEEEKQKNKASPDEVGFEDVQAWIDRLAEQGAKPSTVKQYLVALGQFFTFCTKPYIPEHLRYKTSPVSPDFYPKVVPEQVPEILPDEAVAKLWEYKRNYPASEAQFARNYAIVVLILSTGLRNKEVLDLTLSDVDFHYREISVRSGKGRKARVVDAPDICLAAIENYLNSGARPNNLPDNAPLFGTTAAHEKGNVNARQGCEAWHRGSTNWLSQMIERHVFNQTGIHGVRSHDLRHLFARVSLNATGNLAELQGAMGHTNPNVTERYSGRLMQRRRRESAEMVLAARDAAAESMRKRNNPESNVVTLPA